MYGSTSESAEEQVQGTYPFFYVTPFTNGAILRYFVQVQSIRLFDPDAGPAGDADDQGADEEEDTGTGRYKATVTLHKQILDLLDQAGGTGMTLNVSSCSRLSSLCIDVNEGSRNSS